MDDGSSTESEYYDYSEDEERAICTVVDSDVLGASTHGGPSARRSELAPDAITEMVTHWNNILTPALAAAVVRVTARTSRLVRSAPLAIPLDPPVNALPASSEFVSPFASLAIPTPMKKEKTEPTETTEPLAPSGPEVVDLTLDSDDESDSENQSAAPPTRVSPSSTPRQAESREASGASRTFESARPSMADTVATVDIRSEQPPSVVSPPMPRIVARSQSAEEGRFGVRRVSVPRSSSLTDTAPRAHGSSRAIVAPSISTRSPRQLTLSCTRCHRLVPDHSATPAAARFDCKCCERKYTVEELAVRGANRRCLFCQQSQRPSASATPRLSGSQPTTPRPIDTGHESCISPTPHGDSLFHVSQTSEPASKSKSPRNTARYPARAFPFADPNPKITCVTCHQSLKRVQPPPTSQDPLPWFCTCCQRLLSSRTSPPEKGSGSAVIDVPRCASCSIAACDLDSRLEARLPHFELLKELRRLSRQLETLTTDYLKTLQGPAQAHARDMLQKSPIKIEIDQRMNAWRRRLARARSEQRACLLRGDITQTIHREMFKEQVALDDEENDVRTRLVAYLAVYLHDRRVTLPPDVRGIVSNDQDAESTKSQEPRCHKRNDNAPKQTPQRQSRPIEAHRPAQSATQQAPQRQSRPIEPHRPRPIEAHRSATDAAPLSRPPLEAHRFAQTASHDARQYQPHPIEAHKSTQPPRRNIVLISDNDAHKAKKVRRKSGKRRIRQPPRGSPSKQRRYLSYDHS